MGRRKNPLFEIGGEGEGVVIFKRKFGRRDGYWLESTWNMLMDDDDEEDPTPTGPRWLGATIPEALAALPFRWWLLRGHTIHPDAVPHLKAILHTHDVPWKSWCGDPLSLSSINRHDP